MPLPQLTVYRHDRRKRALITLAGEIDLGSAPLVRTALARCLSDGIRTIDIDLTPVTFCDCSGLNTFLHAAQKTTEAGGTLRLHHPPPTLALILDLTGSGFLLLGAPFGHLRRVNRRPAQGLSGKLTDLHRLTADIRRPGFAMVIAETDGLVGCAFGFPVVAASSGVFAIIDMLVRPHPQDAHVARRLQERPPADHQASLGATLVDRADHPALTALRSWGWLDVGEIWKPITATLLRALVLPVGGRTAARPEGLAHDAWTRWPG